MKNFIQQGDLLTVTSPNKVASGDIIVMGDLVGIAAISCEKDAPLTIATEGVFELPKDKVEIKLGARVKTEKGICTLEKGVNLGVAVATASASEASVRVKLC